jgi:hypothetical protein
MSDNNELTQFNELSFSTKKRNFMRRGVAWLARKAKSRRVRESFALGISIGLVILIIASLLSLFLPGKTVEWVTAIGEIAIAFVIYGEIEAGRGATFVAAVDAEKYYKDRPLMYDAYVDLPLPNEATLHERAVAFRWELTRNAELRLIQERQWTEFSRLRFLMRSSLYRQTLGEWMSQVVVKLWIMTYDYVLYRDRESPVPGWKYGVLAVKDSLDVLKADGFKPMIYRSHTEGVPAVVGSPENLEQLLAHVEELLRTRWS